MKISQLIKSLEKNKEENGDLDIWVVNGGENKEISLITIRSDDFLPGTPGKYTAIVPMDKVQ